MFSTVFYPLTDHLSLVLGALLGTQNGREVEIVNTFELATEGTGELVDHGFLVSRRDQCEPHDGRRSSEADLFSQTSKYFRHSSSSDGTQWLQTQGTSTLCCMNK